MLARDISVWEGLHILPRGAPSWGAKLCTYLRWFTRPDKVNMEPYYELPLPVIKRRSILHFRVGPHSLPIIGAGQDWVAQGTTTFAQMHIYATRHCERHCVFDCPQGLWQRHARIFQNSHDAMRSLMWHREQKSICALVLAIVSEIQTT